MHLWGPYLGLFERTLRDEGDFNKFAVKRVSNQDHDVQYDSVSNWWLEESFPLCQSFISRVSLKINGAAVLLSMCGICGAFSIRDNFEGFPTPSPFSKHHH